MLVLVAYSTNSENIARSEHISPYGFTILPRILAMFAPGSDNLFVSKKGYGQFCLECVPSEGIRIGNSHKVKFSYEIYDQVPT